MGGHDLQQEEEKDDDKGKGRDYYKGTKKKKTHNSPFNNQTTKS